MAQIKDSFNQLSVYLANADEAVEKAGFCLESYTRK